MLNVQSLTQRTFAQIVVFALLLLNSTLAFAQNQVNGIVTDKTGEPLIGVNVVEKGTTNGVITDFNGQFTLNVAQGKTLVFSYVGYTTQEITVKGSSIIRKTKCFDFWERNVLFPKTKRSFFRTPKHPLPCPFPLNFSLLIITKKFGNLAKNRYICIV